MWLRPTPHPTTATLQILDSDTPGSLFLLFFTGKYQRWTNSYRRNPCLLSLAARKNSGKQRNNSGRRRGRSTSEEYMAVNPHRSFLLRYQINTICQFIIVIWLSPGSEMGLNASREPIDGHIRLSADRHQPA